MCNTREIQKTTGEELDPEFGKAVVEKKGQEFAAVGKQERQERGRWLAGPRREGGQGTVARQLERGSTQSPAAGRRLLLLAFSDATTLRTFHDPAGPLGRPFLALRPQGQLLAEQQGE